MRRCDRRRGGHRCVRAHTSSCACAIRPSMQRGYLSSMAHLCDAATCAIWPHELTCMCEASGMHALMRACACARAQAATKGGQPAREKPISAATTKPILAAAATAAEGSPPANEVVMRRAVALAASKRIRRPEARTPARAHACTHARAHDCAHRRCSSPRSMVCMCHKRMPRVSTWSCC